MSILNWLIRIGVILATIEVQLRSPFIWYEDNEKDEIRYLLHGRLLNQPCDSSKCKSRSEPNKR